MTMTRWITSFAFWSLMLPVTAAQEAATPSSQEEIVESVLELQRQIEELLAALPPEVRAELRRRLAEPPEVPRATPGPAAQLPAQPEPEATAQIPAEAPSKSPAELSVADAAPLAEDLKTAEPPSPTAEASASAPVNEPKPGDGIPKLIKRRPKRAPCNTLVTLDENGDGKISSADRYWRYIYIWTDKNGDGQLQDREVQSAYDHKVREIAVSLETFIRNKGSLGEMRVEDRIVLDLRGDGFADRARRDDGLLVIDASALGRGQGPRLLGPGPEQLSGYVAFRSGLRLEIAGKLTELNCP